MLLNLLELFWTFFVIGIVTFGGGYAMIPLIIDTVIQKGWQTKEVLFDFVAISQSTPGVFAVNISTFIGFEQEGVLGAIVSTIGVSLPSFIIIIIIAKIFHHFSDNKFVVGFLNGAKPVIVGGILAVAIGFIIEHVLKVRDVVNIGEATFSWRHLLILFTALLMIKLNKRMHPIYIVLVSGALGYLLFGII